MPISRMRLAQKYIYIYIYDTSVIFVQLVDRCVVNLVYRIWTLQSISSFQSCRHIITKKYERWLILSLELVYKK